MNKDEFNGGARYVGGKIEKTVGDAVDSRDWQVDGVVDQVAGGAQHLYGRARSIVEDAIDTAPELADAAHERLAKAGRQAAEAAGKAGSATADAARDNPILWAVAAAMGGYALGWLIHGRHD